MVLIKENNLKREPWDSSTEKAKTLTLADFGLPDEVKSAAKPLRNAETRQGAMVFLKEIVKKEGVMTSKAGVKGRISGKTAGKIVSNQAVNTSCSSEAHYLAVANVDSLFKKAIEPWKFELNPTKNNDGLKERHYLYAPLEHEGSIFFVKITVKEYINKQLENNLYSIEVIDIRT